MNNNTYKQVFIFFVMTLENEVKIVQDDMTKLRLARGRAEQDYLSEDWSLCPNHCPYCCDPFYGHPHPHSTQTRLKEGMSAEDFVNQYLFN